MRSAQLGRSRDTDQASQKMASFEDGRNPDATATKRKRQEDLADTAKDLRRRLIEEKAVANHRSQVLKMDENVMRFYDKVPPRIYRALKLTIQRGEKRELDKYEQTHGKPLRGKELQALRQKSSGSLRAAIKRYAERQMRVYMQKHGIEDERFGEGHGKVVPTYGSTGKRTLEDLRKSFGAHKSAQKRRRKERETLLTVTTT